MIGMTAIEIYREIASQRKWINDHGGDLSGYINRYGDPDMSHCYGNGGTAIYQADKQHLKDLEAMVR